MQDITGQIEIDEPAQPAAPGTARSMVELVADLLRQQVRSGRYAPGQRLIETEITQELRVSRGPLREAFRRLSAEGLIDLQHNRGARVRQLSRREVASILDIREVLESLAARLAARRIGAGEVEATSLGSLVSQMEVALSDGAIGRYRELNQAFHDLVVEASGNAPLAPLVSQLQVPVLRMQLRALLDVADLRPSYEDHREIADAILRGDEEGADAAMRRHVRRSRGATDALADEFFAA